MLKINNIIDFHSHTFFSDGQLSPAEHIRRAYIAGYKALGITDHVDFSNIDFVYDSVSRMAAEIDYRYEDMTVIPGIEITHVPPHKIGKITDYARSKGIPLIIVHGESPVEPVAPGTNRAAIEAGVDILAHPGLITEADMQAAADNDVYIEISARKGHGITDGHIANLAQLCGTKLVLDSDAHSDENFLTPDFAQKVLYGCGMNDEQVELLLENQKDLLKRIKERLLSC